MAETTSYRIGIAVYHALGDVLNLTPVARQLRHDHPEAHIQWFTSKACEPALRHNPDLDEVVIQEGEWADLDAGILSLAESGDFDDFYAPAPYLNYEAAPGGSLWDLYRAAPGLDWTEPVVPVLQLTPEEIQEARAWWDALEPGPRILIECDAHSQQSPWSLTTVDLVHELLGGLNPLYVFTARDLPAEVARIQSLGGRAVHCGLPWRLNAELFNRCDAFLGISSGISALTGSTACRVDVPSVEFVRGEHWSTAGLGRHRRRRFAYSEGRYRAALQALSLELSGAASLPNFESRVVSLGATGRGRERIACPGCGGGRSELLLAPDIGQCSDCGLTYLQERPDPAAMEAYYRKVYAVGEPTAAPSVRVPSSLQELEESPAFLGARREPLVTEALARLEGQAKKVVDVGCGWGALLLGAQKRGLAGTGFEFTEPNVAYGRTALGLDIRSEAFPGAQLPGGSADLVTFVHSLEHVPDPQTYLDKAAHILREGGILAVVVPNIESLGFRGMGEAWPWLERQWHYTHFSRATLRAMAIQAGFEILDCQTRSGDLGPAFPLNLLKRAVPGASEQDLQTRVAGFEAMGLGEEIRLLARRVGPDPARLRPRQNGPRVLWIRTDSIGDAVLANAMLPALAAAYPGLQLTVVCQAFTAPLYEACPHVTDIIAYDRTRALQDEAYRLGIARRIMAVHADQCLHSVHSREALGDIWVHASGAPVRVGFGDDLCNMTQAEHDQLDSIYTQLIPGLEPTALEMDRHAAFLDALSIPHDPLSPQVWLKEADRAEARGALAAQGLTPENTVVLFPGAQYAPRRYSGYGEALRQALPPGFRVVAIGTQAERTLCASQLEGLGGSANLAGELPLRASIALLACVPLAIGAESGLAQACVALGTPHVVVIGGGHFGRFLPYSPLSALVARPLTCYVCNWACPYASAHCITDVAPEILAAAIGATLTGIGDRPRLFVPPPAPGPGKDPEPLDLAPLLDAALVELVQVEPATVLLADLPVLEPVLTVFCGVWHKDPQRQALLLGHRACLARQTVPVRALYVFDGGDLPPAGLDADFLACSRPLALYEAWDLALQSIRTPYVMNLNLDDRLCPDAAARIIEALDQGADLVGGEWRICFSQQETDATPFSHAAESLPFHPEWPPVPGRSVRLGSGSGERGTFGPATAWRMALHRKIPHYPWRFGDDSPVKIIGDALWWQILIESGMRMVRIPSLLGHYFSHPGEQAEFRNPAENEHEKVRRVGLRVL